jgi:hypothetical protein
MDLFRLSCDECRILNQETINDLLDFNRQLKSEYSRVRISHQSFSDVVRETLIGFRETVIGFD